MPDDMTMGPVEIAVIAFPGNQFTGEIAPAVANLVASGTVAIIDLLFVAKDGEGNMAGLELSELDDQVAAPYRDLDGEVSNLLSDEDLESIGELLEPSSSALAIVWENSWARDFVRAVRGANGYLVAHDRIDAATVADAMAELAADA